ncbi:UvrD-helicase domain-containing protein [Candidatus Poriferisodalis sp.]|uniref:UvrD-helicase domain-containing protein n=1 Tax=Candidatus Poriferisodalis sp. TaxID=3101277 RepID=UPI003D152EA8
MNASAKSGALPADQAERDRVREELGTTLFVEAGAGTGKTNSLIQRVLSLVTSPEAVPLSNIAAITFTEKAAAELRNRIRAELHAELTRAVDNPSDGNAISVERLQSALDELDGAAISTLHSFARRLLGEHPVEAGLPPTFETLDPIASEVQFDERWSAFVDSLLSSDSRCRWAIEMVDAAGVGIDSLRQMALHFNDNWDRLNWTPVAAATPSIPVESLVDAARRLLLHGNECTESTDKLLARFGQLEAWTARLDAARNDRERLAVLLASGAGGIPRVGNVGSKGNWPDAVSIRDGFAELDEARGEAAREVLDAAIGQLATEIRTFTLDAAETRRSSGTLEFHDLLVWARWLLRDSPQRSEVRTALRQRYRRLLLDEFQDTDPIQVELATLMCSVDVDESPRDWRHVETEPGRLFFVGDPKQSIYRFRRADIGLYLAARERFGTLTGAQTSLSVNFRTAAPIIDWINGVFSVMIVPHPSSQPDYAPLRAWRPAAEEGAPVTLLGRNEHSKDTSAAQVRVAEAADVARAIVAVVEGHWSVADPHTRETRQARFEDVAVLIPTRTSLDELELGLSNAGIPYRLEASSFVWRSAIVRDLMMCLQAIADPTDDLAIVSALRTPLYGCGDDDLYKYAQHATGWNYSSPRPQGVPDGPDHPVANGLAHLHELHEAHSLVSPAVIADRLLRDRRVFEQAVAGPRTRETWRQLRFVVDQARAWSESQHSGLRSFLRWARRQASDGAKVTEAVLPESDDDAVRVMTIHASKGLEFPVVVMTGLQNTATAHRDSTEVGFGSAASTPAIRLRSGVQTADYDDWVADEQLAGHHERIRLLYVGATRARDHLVVSLHRKPLGASRPDEHRLTSAQVICEAILAGDVADHAVWADDWSSDVNAMPPASGPAQSVPMIERSEWRSRLDAALASTKAAASLSATTIARASAQQGKPLDDADTTDLAAGLAKDGPDDHLGVEHAIGSRGRYGTSLGRAVHAVLQDVDLRSGDHLAPLAQAAAAAEGLSDRQRAIERYVRCALDSPTVAEAIRGRHWREIYTAAPSDSASDRRETLASSHSAPVIEGYIDLLYEREDGGLVVVDYKTDRVDDEASIRRKVDDYRLQGATYAWCLERSAGRRVSEVVFLFLSSNGPARSGVLAGDDLARAIGEVEAVASNVAS